MLLLNYYETHLLDNCDSVELYEVNVVKSCHSNSASLKIQII